MRQAFITPKSILFFLQVVFVITAAAQGAKDAKYYTTRGDEFFGNKKYKDAIANYTLAINKDDKFAMAYAYRGYSYVADYTTNQEVYDKQLGKAIEDCSKAISLQPDSSSFYYFRSQAYSRKKNTDSAILDLTKAISIEPDSSVNNQTLVDYYNSRITLYEQKRLYYLAILDYNKLISLDSNNVGYYRNRCKAYYFNNQSDSALLDITKVFSIDSFNFINNNYRGLCYNSLGNYELSILDFLTYIVKMPDHGNPYINIISPLTRLKRFGEAALFYKLFNDKKNYKEKNSRFGDKKFESFLTIDKYKFYNYFLTAVTQIAEGKLNEALASLDTASKEYGPEPKDETKRLYSDVLSLNGFVLQKLNRFEEAKINYEQSLVLDPRQPDLVEALQGLQKNYVLFRNLDKTPPKIKLIYANLPTRAFDIVADTTNIIRIPVMGKASDESGIDTVKINGIIVRVESDGTFFGNIELKPGTTSLEITATDKQKNTAVSKFDLNGLANSMAQLSFDASASAPLTFGKYHAILIAEKDYVDNSIPDLRTPIRDANLLKDILVNQYTFDSVNVDTLYNRSREEILETIIAKCKSLTDKDNLLIYYAGHGDTTVDRAGKVDGYLVPSSAKKGLRSYYITSEEIRKAILTSNAKHVLILLDACFSGTFTREVSPKIPGDIEKQYKLDSRKIMTSGNVELVPDDSQFILFLTQYLTKNSEKYLSTKDLWEFISKQVKSTLAQYGDFDGAGDMGGQFIFEKRNK